jgi:hypothetical protein
MTSTIGHILDIYKLGLFYSNKFEVISWHEIYYWTHLFGHIQVKGENTLRVNHFCSKNEMYNKYYNT